MRLLISVIPLDNFKLACTFDNGSEKIADISEYLRTEAFRPLQKREQFNKVQNRQYYIEWFEGEIDLSADTLWAIGVAV